MCSILLPDTSKSDWTLFVGYEDTRSVSRLVIALKLVMSFISYKFRLIHKENLHNFLVFFSPYILKKDSRINLKPYLFITYDSIAIAFERPLVCYWLCWR